MYAGTAEDPPRVPASAGAMIFDSAGRILILKPNYKKGWTVPGGQMEPGGESPWEACQRETREECGIQIVSARLACVDFLRPRPRRAGGLRFLFDCGRLSDALLRQIVVDASEIDAFRFVAVDEALGALSGPVRRRVAAAVESTRCVYLEAGRPLAAVAEHSG